MQVMKVRQKKLKPNFILNPINKSNKAQNLKIRKESLKHQKSRLRLLFMWSGILYYQCSKHRGKEYLGVKTNKFRAKLLELVDRALFIMS